MRINHLPITLYKNRCHSMSSLKEIPKDSSYWNDLENIGYKKCQSYFPGITQDDVPVSFDSLRRKLCLPTDSGDILSLQPIDDDISMSLEKGENLCHRDVLLKMKKQDNIVENVGHIKSVPILDVIDVMRGRYVPEEIGAYLPSRSREQNNTSKKVSDHNNQAYVDCITGYALSSLTDRKLCPGFASFYGHFTAIAPKLRVDITEDFYSIRNQAWFHRGIGTYFTIEAEENESVGGISGKRTRKINIGDEDFGFTQELKDIAEDPELIKEEWKKESESGNLRISCDDELIEITNLPGLEPVENMGDVENEEESDLEDETDDEGSVSYRDDNSKCHSNDNIRDASVVSGESMFDENSEQEDENSDMCSGSESYDSEYDSEDNEKFYAIIPNIPIQSSIYEKLEGPIDKLLEDDDVSEDEWKSIIFQVCFSLAVAQKEMGFIHNDLHTNNVLWSPTKFQNIWYKINNVWYKVPTYGRIIKIIDFGRSYIKINGVEYMSDAFQVKGDAGGQYNYPPYYDSTLPMIPPNPSFDLARFACSMIEGLYHPDFEPDTEVSKLLYSWLIDDRNKNIMWNRNGNDRFQGFGLYKHITRHCHNSVPAKQLENDMFKCYITTSKPRAKDKLKFTFQNDGLPVLIESATKSKLSKDS